MYLRKSASPRWVGTLEGGKVVFIGFNSVQTWSTPVLGRLERMVGRPSVKRVVVDLRLNGGGNNTTYGTFFDILRKSTANRKGRLFVLIGRATFSAAANFAADMDRYTKATFVGEPTGGFVRGYGDTTAIVLPKSGIVVHIAARYWDFRKGPGDRRLAVNADRKVNVTLADFLAGRDPVLAAALSR
jgi:hypothetical protein